jgi:hypothetical protein
MAVQEQTLAGARIVRIYLPLALLITLIAFVGFWRTYFGPLIGGTLQTTTMVHAHAVIYVTWLALFITQAALAASGRLALHMQLGRWIMAYGLVVIVVGLAVALHRFEATIVADELARAQRQLFGPLRDMVCFIPFFAAAWFWRRKPELHKRAMIVATTILLVAAVGRMSFVGRPPSTWKFMIVWGLPIYVAMIHDFLARRIVHPVYLAGLGTMLLMRLVLPLRDGEAWLSLTAWLATLYR